MKRHRQAGLSFVGLLVGVALGLVVAAAAARVVGDHVDAQRRLLLEARLDHDLRAALDLVVRDLRRAGSWGRALEGVAQRGAAAVANPYAALDQPDTTELTYAYARDTDDRLDSAEQVGVRVQRGALQYRAGDAGWQTLTDADATRVSTFTVQLIDDPIELASRCPCIADGACSEAAVMALPGRPQLVRHRVALRLRLHALADPTVQREAIDVVRLRNDTPRGACPA